MINKIVKLKPRYAKWYLDHPDVYENYSGRIDYLTFEKETLLHLTCCLGEPVYGKVIGIGNEGCFLVRFEVGNYKAEYYVEKKSITVVK